MIRSLNNNTSFVPRARFPGLSQGSQPRPRAPFLVSIRHFLSGAAVAALVAALACAGPPADETTKPVKAVVTTALLAGLVDEVGGHLVDVRAMVPPGVDVHSFQTTPQDSIEMSQAHLVVSNGAGLDDFLGSVIRAAAGPGAVHVVASGELPAASAPDGSGLPGLQRSAHKLEQHLTGPADPHYWQNPLYVIHYVERIRDGLIQADGASADAYRANAEQFVQELRLLDQEIAAVLETVPPKRRHLVTYHDAFGHFGARYGWKVSALVSSDAGDVTPASVVAMMDQVRDQGLPAVFAEPQFRSQVLEQAAQDAGVQVGTIYSDVLDGNVNTYAEMMRFNARSLVEHLR